MPKTPIEFEKLRHKFMRDITLHFKNGQVMHDAAERLQKYEIEMA